MYSHKDDCPSYADIGNNALGGIVAGGSAGAVTGGLLAGSFGALVGGVEGAIFGGVYETVSTSWDKLECEISHDFGSNLNNTEQMNNEY